MNKDSRLVYSSDQGSVSSKQPAASVHGAEFVSIHRETKGRGGKTVVVLSGIATADQKKVLKILKSKCACGGAIKGGTLEIQGNKRDLIESELIKLNYKVKRTGG